MLKRNLMAYAVTQVLLVLIDESTGNASAASAQGLGASIAGTLALLLFQLVMAIQRVPLQLFLPLSILKKQP
jgi:hypothetical protein